MRTIQIWARTLCPDVTTVDGPAAPVIRHEMVRPLHASATAITGTIASMQSVSIPYRGCVQVGASAVYVDLPRTWTCTWGRPSGLELPAAALYAISPRP